MSKRRRRLASLVVIAPGRLPCHSLGKEQSRERLEPLRPGSKSRPDPVVVIGRWEGNGYAERRGCDGIRCGTGTRGALGVPWSWLGCGGRDKVPVSSGNSAQEEGPRGGRLSQALTEAVLWLGAGSGG